VNWMKIEDKPPPEDGEYILCHILNERTVFSASYRTYHPNAAGKKTWRDPAGVKVYFTHWSPMLSLPEDTCN